MTETNLRELVEQTINIIEMPEEYVPEYFDDLMQEAETMTSGIEWAEFLTEQSFADPEQREELANLFDSLNSEQFQESTRSDYNVKYGGENGPFEEIYKLAQGPATNNAEKKPAVKSTPGHFTYNDGGWGPIERTGLNKRDYEAKYSKTGSLTERKPARKPGVVSPALKEAIANFSETKRLIENGVLELSDLDLLED